MVARIEKGLLIMKLNYKKIYDISMPITEEIPVWKGREEKRPKIHIVSDFEKGTVYESSICLNMHTGTHLDRTLHMIPDGNRMNSLKLEELITECKVLDLTEVKEMISAENLRRKEILPGEFILLKTRNSYDPILEKDFIFLEKSGAEYLASIPVKGVGIDALGVERGQPGHTTHMALMAKGIHILEGLQLSDVREGRYQLIALPLNIPNAEAAPVRAVLLEE